MRRLLLIGTGLIGSSFALAARSKDIFDEVVGADSNPANLRAAIDLGVCSRKLDSRDSISGICVAVPTRGIASIVQSAIEQFGTDVPIFDVGSVKEQVCEDLRSASPNFVPCHPIAGSHLSGPNAARADLFAERTVVNHFQQKIPSRRHIEVVKSWWLRLGCKIVETTPSEHDAIVALTSHLPHLLSYALMTQAEQSDIDLQLMTGGGFRDATRLAGSNSDVWSNILTDNAQNLRRVLDSFVQLCESLMQLTSQSTSELSTELARIQESRTASR